MADKNRHNDESRKPPSSAASVASSGADSSENPSFPAADDGKNNLFIPDDPQQKWKWSKTRQIGLWMKSSVREATHTSKKTVEFVRDVTRTGKQAVTGVVTGENPFVNFDDADADPISQSLKKVKRKQNFSGFVAPNVRTIDEAMFSLHTLLSEQGRSPFDATTTAKSMEQDDISREDDDDGDDDDFDWLLDGDRMQKVEKQDIEISMKSDASHENKKENNLPLAEMNMNAFPVIISIPGHIAKEAVSAFEKLSFFDPELFMLLPTDTSTLEGRFTQRMQEESNPTSTVSVEPTIVPIEPSTTDSDSCTKSLFTDDYYNAEYDPIMDLILATPLIIEDTVVHDDNHQPGGVGFQLDALDPFVSDVAAQLDGKSTQISAILQEKINANVNLFYELSSGISVIEHDVSQALLSSKEGSKLLRRTRAKDLDSSGGGGILGWDYIALMSYERDNIKLMNDILESVSSVVALENEITSFFDAMSVDTSTFLSTMPQLPKLIEVSMTFRDRAFHSIELMEVQCLNDLRTRASKIMLFLCQRLEACLINFLSAQCKRDFKSHLPREWKSETLMEYVNILSARLALEPFVKQESVTLDEPSVHISWTSSITKALTFESHRNVAKALLKPTANSSSVKTESDSTGEISDPTLRQIQESVEKYKVDDEHLSSLQIDIQSLMNMRFETEARKSHLPWVYHQLCGYTAQLLHLFYILNKGHETSDDVLFDSIKSNPDYRGFLFLAELSKNRAELWKSCETMLVSFLDMYLASVSKVQGKPQADGEPIFDEKMWSVNMEGLYDVLQMTNHIIVLAAEFNGSSSGANTTKPLLREKVYEIIGHHLRSFEVDAMTSIGYMLAHESWLLCQMSLSSESLPTQHDRFLQGFVREIQHAYPDLSNEPRILESFNVRLSDNKFSDERRVNKPFFPSFASDGNPFITKRSKDAKKISKENFKVEWCSNLLEPYCQQLLNLYGYKQLDFIWGTKTSSDGLCKWASRSLYCLRKFPMMANEIVKTSCNIFDLYLVSVFRICACDEANANVMLGAAARSGFIIDESHALLVDNVVKDASAVSRGSTTAQRPKETVTKNPAPAEIAVKFIEADMVAPQRAETDRRTKFQGFIRRGQESRYRASNLRKYELILTKKFNFIPSDKLSLLDEMRSSSGLLHDRLMACYSSLLVASFAHVSLALMNEYLKTVDASSFSHIPNKEKKVDSDLVKIKEGISDSIKDYANSYLDMVPLLCDICSRMAAVRATKAKDVVTAIVKIGPDWNKKSKFHEQSNDYADLLIERICLIWGFMSSWHLKSYPENITGKSWSLVIEAGFLSLLEGFSQISSCSTEGRALMSIDLATYSSGVNRRNVKEKLETYEESFSSDLAMPPSPTVTRGMQYVDTYIKVFYFPLEDVMKWIEKNRGDYYLSQLLSLVTCCVLDRSKEKDRQKILAEMMQKVKAL